MDFCFLKGLIVVMLIHHCKSQDQSNSSLPSTAVAPQDDEALLQETEVVPAVAPPSLKEVEEAVHEASEKVEGLGAGELLKELLESFVEAALGEAGGGGGGGEEEKVEEAGEQEVVEEEAVGGELGVAEAEDEAETGAMEQAAEEEVVVEDVGATVDIGGGGDEQEVVAAGVEEEVEAIEAVLAEAASEEEGVVVEPLEEAAAVAEGVGGATEEQETADTSPLAVEEPVAAAEQEEGGEIETGGEGAEGEVVIADEGEAETEVQEAVEAPEEVPVQAESPEQETVADADPSLGVAEVEQAGGVGGEGEAEEEETQVSEGEGGEQTIELAPDEYEEMETTQSVVGEPVEEEETVVEKVEEGEGTEVTDGGEVGETKEAAGGDGESMVVVVVDEEAVSLEAADPLGEQAGEEEEEEQIALETSDPSQAEDQEVLVIPGAEPVDGADDDTSIEQGSEDQAIPPGPSLGGKTESNVMGGEELVEEESNHANEIITSTSDLLSHDPAVAEPTLDNVVQDIPATPPQSEGVEPGETNELVEKTTVKSEVRELGLEAWKIGAISAAVFLVLATVVIIVYILKCRNKSTSAAAPEGACEEGRVEVAAATGADCSDNTLPDSSGDTQQIAALDPSDPTLTQQLQEQEEQGIAMPALQPNCLESANPGPGADPSPDLRTSVL